MGRLCCDLWMLDKVHEFSLALVAAQPALNSNCCVHDIHVYVDGSGGNAKGSPSWGIVPCLVDHSGAVVALGFLGDLVIMEPVSAFYLGAVAATSFSAEMSAIIFGCLWVLQSGLITGPGSTVRPRVVILYDSTGAAGSATCAFRDRQESQLSDMAGAVMTVTRAFCDLSFQHEVA